MRWLTLIRYLFTKFQLKGFTSMNECLIVTYVFSWKRFRNSFFSLSCSWIKSFLVLIFSWSRSSSYLKVTSAENDDFWKYIKSHVLFLRYSILNKLIHSVNFESRDVFVSISTQVRVHFWIYLVNHKPFGHETWLGYGYDHG